MVHTEKINLLTKQALYLISAHTVAYILYNVVHEKIDILYAITEYLPILLPFCLGPLAAVLFLSTRAARPVAVFVLGILAAELIYNIYTRFAGTIPFTVQKPSFIWTILYEGLFGTVLILEVVSIWVTFKLLQEIHKQTDIVSANPL